MDYPLTKIRLRVQISPGGTVYTIRNTFNHVWQVS